MKAQRQTVTGTAAYTVNTLQTPAGITIREYLDNGGTVFAVIWRGPVMPDLQQVLGQYFSQYVAEAKSRHDQRSHLSIRHTGLVLHAGGHLRAFFGTAYVPTLLPAGLSPDALR